MVEKVKEKLEEILGQMNIKADVSMEERDGYFYAVLESEAAGILIGYKGEVLDSLQYILNLTFREELGTARIIIDVNDYRKDRESSLRELSKHTSDKVRFTGKPIELTPMSSYERRIIHMEVGEQEGVESLSVGEGPSRRVQIKPKE